MGDRSGGQQGRVVGASGRMRARLFFALSPLANLFGLAALVLLNLYDPTIRPGTQ